LFIDLLSDARYKSLYACAPWRFAAWREMVLPQMMFHAKAQSRKEKP
jgi:hypothetical protein